LDLPGGSAGLNLYLADADNHIKFGKIYCP